ncbi:hypothetical protein Hanom_Chr01g00004791 [Helianthus anomalus]
MFVHLTNRTEFFVHVRSFIKRTNINELPAERFTNCSLNVRFVYSPTHDATTNNYQHPYPPTTHLLPDLPTQTTGSTHFHHH